MPLDVVKQVDELMQAGKKITNVEAIRLLRTRAEWAHYTEENLLRRYYEARKRQRDLKKLDAPSCPEM